MRALAPILAICIVLPASTLAQSKRETLLEDWRAAVAEHHPGKLDEPVERIGTWSSADLRAVLEALRPELDAEAKRDPDIDRLLITGAVMHSDIAMLTPGRRITTAPGDRFISLSIDGRDSGQRPRDPGWPFAAQLLAEVRHTPELQAVVKLWFRAISAHMLAYAQLADLGQHLDAGRRLFRDDPDMMFDTGCFYEGLASPRAQAAIADTLFPGSRGRPEVSSVGDSLEKAEEWYSRVLTVAPGHHDARVHRGRVRTLRGRGPAAIADLRAATEATDPYVKYHALLFLGGAYESISRIDDARAAYERAAAVYGYAQSPRIALSRLATRRGDMPAAERYIQQVLSLSPDAPYRGDPFWSYYEGIGRLSQALMTTLRQAVANLRKPS